jgi:hypothetical protein
VIKLRGVIMGVVPALTKSASSTNSLGITIFLWS